jgi:hypothetical protein
MIRTQNPVSYTRFLALGTEARNSYLKHPVWANRCRCGTYGTPYPHHRHNDGSTIHTSHVCQPVREAIL